MKKKLKITLPVLKFCPCLKSRKKPCDSKLASSTHKIKSWFKETFMAMMCMIAVMSVHFFITCKSLHCKSF